MKRVKAACILQTLVFAQKPEMGYSKERSLELNREEVEHYKAGLERARTKYRIIDRLEQEDGSIVVHLRKQYNDKADVSEYFEQFRGTQTAARAAADFFDFGRLL